MFRIHLLDTCWSRGRLEFAGAWVGTALTFTEPSVTDPEVQAPQRNQRYTGGRTAGNLLIPEAEYMSELLQPYAPRALRPAAPPHCSQVQT
uniref:Uncharacterized protein n=1 Tax=Knipowitschia caucasica TaxID=637954 RepID=A0AAV2M0D3_KNICA